MRARGFHRVCFDLGTDGHQHAGRQDGVHGPRSGCRALYTLHPPLSQHRRTFLSLSRSHRSGYPLRKNLHFQKENRSQHFSGGSSRRYQRGRRWHLAGDHLVRLIANNEVPLTSLQLGLYVFITTELVQPTNNEILFSEPIPRPCGLQAFICNDFKPKVEVSAAFVFHSNGGSPLHETNILNQGLYPALEALQLEQAATLSIATRLLH